MPPDDDAQLRYDELEARLTASVSERMLDLAGLREGQRVLDLASGRGEPSLRAAGRVGPTGQVLGVDLQERLLAVARERAARAGLSNVEFRAMDAETVDDVAHGFDVATVRWGLMYLRSPERALAAVRRALQPHAPFVAALWAEPERVPWSTLPRSVTARYAPFPAFDPSAPGPFRYATLSRIEHDFTAAGFTLEHVEEADVPVVEAETGAGIVAWTRAVLGRWADLVPEADRSRWEAELALEAEAFRRGPTILVGGVTRIVLARAGS